MVRAVGVGVGWSLHGWGGRVRGVPRLGGGGT